MNNKQKLWIITESFYPEELSTSYILYKIAIKLSLKYDIHVVCGPLNAQKGRIYTNQADSLEQISVKRLSSLNLNTNHLFYRLIKFIILSLQLFFYAIFHINKKDRILIVTNPAPLLVLMSCYKKFKNIDLTILIHDIFPENTIPAGIISNTNSWKYKLLKYIFDKSYSHASRLIVIGRDMKKVVENKIRLVAKKPDIFIIENWGDTNTIQPLSMVQSEHIHIQYAGNLGRVQGLLELLEVISNVQNPLLHFDFYGDGALKKEMIDFVNMHKISDQVSFFDAYKREQQTDILGKSTLSVITLSKGMYGLGVPSKVYNILAAGRAILYIGDKNSEIALMIEENNIGFCFEAEDKDGLLKFFNDLMDTNISQFAIMGENARILAESKYSEAIILNKFLEIV